MAQQDNKPVDPRLQRFQAAKAEKKARYEQDQNNEVFDKFITEKANEYGEILETRGFKNPGLPVLKSIVRTRIFNQWEV